MKIQAQNIEVGMIIKVERTLINVECIHAPQEGNDYKFTFIGKTMESKLSERVTMDAGISAIFHLDVNKMIEVQ